MKMNISPEERSKDTSPKFWKAKSKKLHSELQLYHDCHQKTLKKLFASGKVIYTTSELQLPEGMSEAECTAEGEGAVKPSNEAIHLPKFSATTASCSMCNSEFENVDEQRQHFKLDWHRYNLKRSHLSQPPVLEEEFNEMIDDLSSIEGTDDECDEVIGKKTEVDDVSRLVAKISVTGKKPEDDDGSKLIQNSLLTFVEFESGEIGGIMHEFVPELIKRCKSNFENSYEELMWVLEPFHFAVILISGGHFAGAIYYGKSCVRHKTFHSYTVRAKQGGSQSSADSRSSSVHPNSAGASLRRYNEMSFRKKIEDLLQSWKPALAECKTIYYRKNVMSDKVLFGGKSPLLDKGDRVKKLKFPTKRPTFSESNRIKSVLTSVKIYENRENFLQVHKISLSPKRRSSKPSEAKTPFPKTAEVPLVECKESQNSSDDESSVSSCVLELVDTKIDLTELKEMNGRFRNEVEPAESKPSVKTPKPYKKQKNNDEERIVPTGFIAEIYKILETNGRCSGSDYEFQTHLVDICEKINCENVNQLVNNDKATILHVAALKNCKSLICPLLESGCDPTIKNKKGQVAYCLSQKKEVRDEFRQFMSNHPDKYDYKKAQIPPPLSEELENERKEKKRAQNKLRREKEKQKRKEKWLQEQKKAEANRYLNLSDREKRALAAERRILNNSSDIVILSRCFECATDITGKVPFEYSDNLFCSPKCLASHRRKHPTILSP